jgi:hypothetical protein
MQSRTLALTIAGGSAVGVAAALVRLKRPAASSALERLRVRSAWPSHLRRGERGRPETFQCDCGERYRVAGSGRHRVYWPADAPQSDPVLSGRCAACDRPLPREQQSPAPVAPG